MMRDKPRIGTQFMKSTELSYPAVFQAEEKGGFSVSFPDFPEAHTQGETEQEAFAMAVDCLHTAIEWRLTDKEEIPSPDPPRRGQIAVPALALPWVSGSTR